MGGHLPHASNFVHATLCAWSPPIKGPVFSFLWTPCLIMATNNLNTLATDNNPPYGI